MKRSRNEPLRQPNVRKMKYRLVANAASLRVMPSRSMRTLGAVVFVPTSIPTWHIMPMKENSTTGLVSNCRQSANDDERPAGSSSFMGVTASMAAAASPMMKYTRKSARQPKPNVGIAAVAPHMAM